jgi:hypothetical protein
VTRKYSKIYAKVEVYGVLRGSKVHELLFTNEIEGEDFFNRIGEKELLIDKRSKRKNDSC